VLILQSSDQVVAFITEHPGRVQVPDADRRDRHTNMSPRALMTARNSLFHGPAVVMPVAHGDSTAAANPADRREYFGSPPGRTPSQDLRHLDLNLGDIGAHRLACRVVP
jgi:hypothetical protein